MADRGDTVVSPLFGEVVRAAAPAGTDPGLNLLADAALDADERQEATHVSQPVEQDTDDEDDVLATFTDAVRATIKMNHEADAEYVACAALKAGCSTLPEMHDWLARQHMLATRSGFRPPNPRHFPEPEIVQLVKYLRYADKARETL